MNQSVNQNSVSPGKLSITEKITHLSAYIAKSHPELYKFIEEMPMTVPIEKNPTITSAQLESYFESLSLLIKKIEVVNGNFKLFPDEVHT